MAFLSPGRLNKRRGASSATGPKCKRNPILAAGVLLVSVLLIALYLELGKDELSPGALLGVASDNVKAKSTLLNNVVALKEEPEPANKAHLNKNKSDNAAAVSSDRLLLTERPVQPVTIGYAISLIKCGDFQSTNEGLTDAAIVLRHSVHLQSSRNAESGSNYDYKMYAILHTDADKQGCGQALKDAGFEVLVRSPPVKLEEIEGEFLRKHIKREWCCGHDEMIKLYAYTIFEVPIIVHVDVDYIFAKPMDHLFDAMLYTKDSQVGSTARAQIPVEFPKEVKWPDNIQAFMTRDWPQVIPGRKAGYQAGFLVAKTNQQVFDQTVAVLRKGDYVEGYQYENGWGGQGYGGYVGAMAMQGLLAYTYDILFTDTWVELNQCRYNHMGMDVLYRAHPSFRPNHKKVGQCRNNRDYCEDCMKTELSNIYNVHYTYCKKPWNCVGEGSHQKDAKKNFGKSVIPEDQVNYDHCMELMTVWHTVRSDLETKLRTLTGDQTINDGQAGDYKKDVFQGHCKANGAKGYLPLTAATGTFQRTGELYAATSR
jgi:hypothetical protein